MSLTNTYFGNSHHHDYTFEGTSMPPDGVRPLYEPAPCVVDQHPEVPRRGPCHRPAPLAVLERLRMPEVGVNLPGNHRSGAEDDTNYGSPDTRIGLNLLGAGPSNTHGLPVARCRLLSRSQALLGHSPRRIAVLWDLMAQV